MLGWRVMEKLEGEYDLVQMEVGAMEGELIALPMKRGRVGVYRGGIVDEEVRTDRGF